MIATCRALYLATLAGFFSLSTHSAHAANWVGGVDGAWETGANWGGSVPSATDVAVFTGTESAIVSDSQTVGRVNVGSASVVGDSSVTISSGGTLTFNTGSNYRLRQIWGGSGGTGTSTINVTGGTLNAYDGVDVGGGELGQDAAFNVTGGGTATITNGNFDYTSTTALTPGGLRTVLVDGAGSTLTVSGQTNIDGYGTLTISNGGTFTTGSGTITGVVAGAGGTFVQDGVGGTTTLSGTNTFTGNTTVTNGTLEIGGSGRVGDYTGSISIASGAVYQYSSDQMGANGGNPNRFGGAISGAGTFVVDTATGSVLTRGEVSVATIEIKSGTLIQQANASSLGSAGTTVYLGDTTGSADATIEYSGGAGERTQKTAIIVRNGSTGTKTLTGITSPIDNTDITLNDNLTLASKQHNNNDRLLTFGGVISGAGGLIIDDVPSGNGDQGLVVLSNADNNTYTGATVVDSGVLREVTVGNGTAAGSNTTDWGRSSSGTTINTGATLVIDTSSMTDNRSRVDVGTITVNSGATLELAHNSTNLGVDKFIWTGGSILGDGTMRKTGAAYADIAWVNSSTSLDAFNGLIDVDEGTLAVNPGNAATIGSGNADLDVASGATFDLRTGTFQIDALDGSGTITNSGGDGNTLTIGNNDGSGTFSGVITQTDPDAFSLVKNGTGTQTLSGVNTHTGGTTLNSGRLHLGTIGAAGTGTLTLSGGTLTALGTNTAQTNDIVVTAATTTAIFSDSSSDNRYTGNISGSGTLNFGGTGSGQGTGTVRIYNLDDFTGTIHHAAGSAALFMEPGSQTQATTAKIFTSGATNGQSIRFRGGWEIGELSGTGGKILGWTNETLTINQSTTTTYSGHISDNGNKVFSINKAGSGTLTLDSANSHTGTTTVSGGTLALASGFSHSGIGAYAVGTDGTSATLKIAHLMDISSHAMTIGDGGVISPGNSPGTAITGAQTWNDGGSYLWEINDSDGSKGLTLGGTNGWDWLDITGTLDLDDLSTGGFTIDIDSLSLANSIGDAAGFESWSKGDGIVDYSFIIATTSAGISGFDATDFSFDSSGFSNGPSWDWQIKLSGNDLVLEAYAVPEPSSTALLGLGGLALMLRRKRS